MDRWIWADCLTADGAARKGGAGGKTLHLPYALHCLHG